MNDSGESFKLALSPALFAHMTQELTSGGLGSSQAISGHLGRATLRS